MVLPSTTQLEHFDLQGSWGHHYISMNNPAVPPLGESASHGELMRRLATALRLDSPAFLESDEQIAASALPPEIDLQDLRERGWVKAPPVPLTLPWSRPRVHIAGNPPPVPSLPTGCLRLLTPKAHHFLNATFANMPAQRQATGDPTLEVHPDDAEERGLRDGGRARVRNTLGVVEAAVRVTDDVPRGVVVLPGKWWSADSAVTNVLSGPLWSPSGQPAYNDLFVHVVAVADTGVRPGTDGPVAQPISS